MTPDNRTRNIAAHWKRYIAEGTLPACAAIRKLSGYGHNASEIASLLRISWWHVTRIAEEHGIRAAAGLMEFYIGLHQPSDARHFDRAFVSVNRLRKRKSPFAVGRWIMDSGAFTEVSTHGRYRHPVSEYAEQIRRWSHVGQLEAAVAQDYMCEPWIVAKTGLSVEEHQRLTTERYDALVAEDLSVPILPVLQGFCPADYVRHIRQYASRLRSGMWVGVGSVCKRNGQPYEVAAVLSAIRRERPDLRLHGFGLKVTALSDYEIRTMLHSADSMAWSFAARKAGRNANDWREAKLYEASVVNAQEQASQLRLMLIDVPDG